MVAVSNTSPIINLAAIKQLHILELIFGNILIPPAVYREIAVVGAGQPGSEEVQTLSWIQTQGLTNPEPAASLRLELDAGEADAISLAIQEQASILLLDERRGRGIASGLGLNVLGTLGVLIDAKRRRIIHQVKPEIDGLVAEAGFWVDPYLYERVLEIAGEQVRRQ